MKNLNWLRERLIDKLGSAESVSGSSEGSGYWRGRADASGVSAHRGQYARGQVDRRAVWRKSVERFGRDKQSIVCMEECAELIQAVSKRLRGRPDPEHNLAEEMADVTICLKLLQIMYDITDDELDEWVERKTMRQKQRMEQ